MRRRVVERRLVKRPLVKRPRAGVLGLALGPAVLAAVAAAAGCGGERIAECDALRATVEQVAECGKLGQAQRVQVDQAARTLKDALDRLEDVGPGRAPAELVNEARRTCVKQDEDLRRMYEKVAPECLR